MNADGQTKYTIDSVRLEKLHSLLIQKIEEEWLQKWQSHGKDFQGIDKLPSLNAFLEALLEDIEKTIKSKIGLKATAEILISKDSLRRFIQQLQTSAKFKTRQTIALYIGYEGWDNFLEKNDALFAQAMPSLGQINSAEPVEFVEPIEQIEPIDTAQENKEHLAKTDSPPSQKKRKKRIIWFVLLGFLAISAIIIGFFKPRNTKTVLFKLIEQKKYSFPTVAYVKYNQSEFDLSNAYIKQHNQPLDWYLKNDTRIYKLDTITRELYAENSRILYFDKPGLHHIELVSGGKTIQEIAIPVRANDWFGIAYAQEKTGNKDFVYSDIEDWKRYSASQGKKQLSLPRDFLKDNSLDSRYRSDFYFSGDVDIDTDEMSMEMDFTSVAESESLDCKYLQMGFIDANAEFTFIYCPISTCSSEGQVRIGKSHDSIPFPNNMKDILNFNTEKQQHSAKLYFKNKKVYVELDGSLRYDKTYNIDMGKLEVFYISLNGASRINRFKVSNTRTFKTVYEESFD